MPKYPDGSEKPDDPSAGADTPFGDGPPIPIPPKDGHPPQPQPINNTNPNPGNASSVRREHHGLEKLNSAGTLVLAVVAVVAAYIYGRQLGVMKDQLREMHDSSQQTNALICVYRQQVAEMQRQSVATQASALAAIQQANTVYQSSLPQLKVTKGGAIVVAGQGISVPVDVQNTGHGPAINATVQFVAKFMDAGTDPVFSYGRETPFIQNALWSPGTSLRDGLGKIIGISAYKSDGSELMADEKMQSDFLHGRKDVVLYGQMSYWDSFHVKHWARFCSTSVNYPNGTLSTKQKGCTNYNKADSNRLIDPPSFPPTMAFLPEIPCSAKREN